MTKNIFLAVSLHGVEMDGVKKKKCTIPQCATQEKYIHRQKKKKWYCVGAAKDAEIWDVGRKRVRASAGEVGVNQRDRDVPPQDNTQNTSSGRAEDYFDRFWLFYFPPFSKNPFQQWVLCHPGWRQVDRMLLPLLLN